MLRDTELELIIYDQHERKFDNFSSLAMDWTSSNETIAHLSNGKSMQEIAKSDASGQTWLHGEWSCFSYATYVHAEPKTFIIFSKYPTFQCIFLDGLLEIKGKK